MTGEPINLLIKNKEGTFVLDEDALERLLGDKKELAVVISIAGPFRKGKSFLLDYMLRYLKSGFRDLGEPNKPLEGFSWRGGSERDTTGLLAWSKVFNVKLIDGREAGVILLDTQGAFDSHSTMKDSAIVFALSTLISSVQIYNLSQNIQEDDLQHLHLFTEYGRIASKHSYSYPFQRLLFLIRDWAYSYEAEYGFEGGQQLVDKRLMMSEDQHQELYEIRRHISNCFSDVQGFLMPHPGNKVAFDQNFDGKLSDLDRKFRKYLEIFIKGIFDSDSLLVKTVNEEELRLKDLKYYFKSYMDAFSGDTLPEPRSILVATAEANHLTAVAAAKDTYNAKMNKVCGSSKPYVHPDQLENDHRKIKDGVLQQFRKKPKMGSKELSESFINELIQSIEEMYINFKQLNQAKNSYMTFLTPGIFLGSAVVFYLISGMFSLIGIYSVANIFNFCTGIYLVGAATWAYTRWTGDLEQVGRYIDYMAHFLWHQIILPSYIAATTDH